MSTYLFFLLPSYPSFAFLQLGPLFTYFCTLPFPFSILSLYFLLFTSFPLFLVPLSLWLLNISSLCPSPPSLPLPFPRCLSSLACTTVAASKAIKQWEFSTQQMCRMDGRMSGRGWRWAAHRLHTRRREDNLHLHVCSCQEHDTTRFFLT